MSKDVKIPVFRRGSLYSDWKVKIERWRRVCKRPKKDWGILVSLEALEDNDKAEKAISSLTTAELNEDDGLDRLLLCLDSAFQGEESDNMFHAYTTFNDFERSPGMSMQDYINEYEHLNNKIVGYGINLPDFVLGFQLLKSSGLSEEQKQMAKTHAYDLTFKSIAGALRKVFGSCQGQGAGVARDIKVEETHDSYMASTSYKNSRRGAGNSNQRRRQRPLNPLNKFGMISRCAICDSKMHWAGECQHNEKNMNAQSVHMMENEDPESEDVYDDVPQL